MIYRYIYACYAPENAVFSDIAAEKVTTVTLSAFRDLYFLYYETDRADLAPNEVITGPFRPFPDGSLFYRMPEVFHYSRPLSDDHWKRKIPGKTPLPRLNRLRYEKYSSYIFQHFRFQEEYPGDGDKYGVIAAFQNYIFFYCEDPTETETEKIPGLLSTKDTPLATWDSEMSKHFLPWDDFAGEWRTLPVVWHR